jgi:hypothetical protein
MPGYTLDCVPFNPLPNIVLPLNGISNGKLLLLLFSLNAKPKITRLHEFK